MRLTVYNGSPKPGPDNTGKLLEKFLEGFTATPGNTYEIHKLNHFENKALAVEHFRRADCVLLAFPLYVYTVPAGVKEFIEALVPMRGQGGKKIGFLVQFGFPEAVHARPLEAYLRILAQMLGCEYLGTIIKGGCNGLREYPEKAFRRVFDQARLIGRRFGETGAFDPGLLKTFARPERLSPLSRYRYNLLMKLGNKIYWDPMLKRNGAMARSWERPYAG